MQRSCNLGLGIDRAGSLLVIWHLYGNKVDIYCETKAAEISFFRDLYADCIWKFIAAI